MNQTPHICIPMPDLSPQAAYELSNWLATIAHEVDFYYASHIRTFMAERDREMTEIETEIERQRQADDRGNMDLFL